MNAHGTATAVNDFNETRAIKRVFGNAANKLSISSTKSMHGHCLGAGGGIEAVAAVKAIGEGFIPPTVGLDEPDPECDLDYTPERRAQSRGQLRHVEFLRLWRPQRRAGVRPAACLSAARNRINSSSSSVGEGVGVRLAETSPEPLAMAEIMWLARIPEGPSAFARLAPVRRPVQSARRNREHFAACFGDADRMLELG